MNTTPNHTTLNSLQFHVLARESLCLSFVSENVCGGYTQIGVFGVGYGHSFTFGTNLWPCSNAKATTTIVHQSVAVTEPIVGQSPSNSMLAERSNALLLLLFRSMHYRLIIDVCVRARLRRPSISPSLPTRTISIRTVEYPPVSIEQCCVFIPSLI